MNDISQCCKAVPTTHIVKSTPSTGGEHEGNRKYLIKTNKGNLWGICSDCNHSSHFEESWPSDWRETNPEYIWIKEK